MSSWRQQAVIEAPVEEVWTYVGDPRRYPEWAADVLEVTGLAKVEQDAEFQQVTRTALRRPETTTFKVEELDDLHVIKLRCQESGFYSRWALTAAREQTFADIEIGIEPTALQYRLMFGALGRRYMRRIVEQSIAGIQSRLGAGAAVDGP